MKQLRLTTVATVLMLALSFSAFAGDMATTLTPPTQPTMTVAGQMDTTAATTSTATAVDPLTQIILVMLNLLPRI